MAFWGKNDDENKKTASSSGAVSTVPTKSTSAQGASAPAAGSPQFFNPQSVAAAGKLSAVANEEPKVRSALGPGTVIHGKLSFDAPVSIDGKLSGEIYSSKALVVGKSGSIDATVEVASLIIRGVVKGTIKAAEKIEIKEGGQLIGDVSTPTLIMEDGCVFNGSCTMPKAAARNSAEAKIAS